MKKYEKYSLPARLASPADAILQMRRRKGRLKTRFKPRTVLQRWKADIKATGYRLNVFTIQFIDVFSKKISVKILTLFKAAL
ncbi:hypothetical protein [Neisseria dentiae]|uniref:hypothetical protein n=1 Tax=Neisseria dentiae TaxID=194197 RepID=UPI0035A059B8